MHKNLRNPSLIILFTCHVFISTIYSQELKFSDSGNAIDLNQEDVKLFNFQNFEDDDQFPKILDNTSISFSDPGDMGTGFVIQNPSEEIKNKIAEGYKTYLFNKYISDIIPLQRRLGDHRNEHCHTPDRILKTLLPTSVIMCFYNEALSMLLRSIQSILDRTPDHLISEIILVDDFSEHDELKEELEIAIENLPKVKLIRLPQREGLIRARLIGADLALSPVLTFLDSHIEASEGWLEPLLDRVTRSWKTIAIPYLDHIDRDTLAYNVTTGDRKVGGFTWDLLFTWKDPTPQDLKNAKTLADPITSPTMPGGLFSIHKDFFEYLSKYDDQFEVWGAENLEISFKAWLCGGRIEIVPCSRVGHLERGVSPYKRIHFRRNTARLAAVWLDEFVEFFYAHNSEATRDYGDVSDRLAVKEKMNCHSFDWYMNNVVPDMFNPKKSIASGEVKNLDYSETLCLDAHISPNQSTELSTSTFIWGCHGLGDNQYWYYSTKGEIRKGSKCLDYFGTNVTLLDCHGHEGNQRFEYHADTGVILHTTTNLCLTLDDKPEFKVTMSPCQGEMNQRWKFKTDKFHEAFKDFDFEYRRHEMLMFFN